MLLEFSCSNHRSIREEVFFSMIAGKDTAQEERTEEFDGVKVLKAAVMYGANGSGKSNFIDCVLSAVEFGDYLDKREGGEISGAVSIMQHDLNVLSGNYI